MSNEQKLFLKKHRFYIFKVRIIQILIVVFFLVLWEFFSKNGIINPFIFSSPSRVINIIIDLYKSNLLLNNVWVTIYETLIAFVIGICLSILIAIILYTFNFLYKVFEPFLTIINSLPKVALGPIIIIVAGANIKSIILMAVLINVIVSTIVILNSFYNTNKIKIKLLQSLGANKWQILKYLVIPESFNTIISSFKLCISMSLIGVISGEFLVSKEGLGYLIIYGTQVFNLDLVICSIILLLFISYALYRLVERIEKKLIKDN